MQKISFDLYLCQTNGLDNERQMYTICENIVKSLGIKEFSKPIIIPYFYGKNRQDDGISCVCIFKIQNQIGFFTAHSFNKRKIVYFDLISPKTFNKNKTKEILKDAFKVEEVSEATFDDGTKTWGIELSALLKTNENFSFDSLFNLIESLIKTLNMTKISNTIIEASGESIFAVALIAESHIAFIFDKKTKQLYVDIFSCKYFDEQVVKKLIKQYCCCDFDSSVSLRGLKHNNFIF